MGTLKVSTDPTSPPLKHVLTLGRTREVLLSVVLYLLIYQNEDLFCLQKRLITLLSIFDFEY